MELTISRKEEKKGGGKAIESRNYDFEETIEYSI